MSSTLGMPAFPDPLNKAERKALGRRVRLDFPLRDVNDMKRVVRVLEKLTNRMRAATKLPYEEFTILANIRVEVKAAQQELLERPKPKMQL